jgi:hypothetical protein
MASALPLRVGDDLKDLVAPCDRHGLLATVASSRPRASPAPAGSEGLAGPHLVGGQGVDEGPPATVGRGG